MACYFLLQGVFLTQGSNPSLLCLLQCRQILYHCTTWEAQFIVQWGLNNVLEIVGRIKDVVEVPGVERSYRWGQGSLLAPAEGLT